jgi:hypothetical protein
LYFNNFHRNKKKSQVITLQFGANVKNPSQCGFFIYNGSRLISTPEMLNKKFEKNGIESNGIVAIVNIPYSAMEPSQYKTDILKTRIEKEIIKLKKIIEGHMECYLKDFKFEIKENHKFETLNKLWDMFGYDLNENLMPRLDQGEVYYRHRYFKTKNLIQCDRCRKFRVLTHDSRYVNFKFPDNWVCEDLNGMTCHVPEKEVAVKKSQFIKEPKPSQQNKVKQKQKKTTKFLKFIFQKNL